MNVFHFLGRLINEPSIRKIAKDNGGDTYVSNFSLVLTEKFKKNEEEFAEYRTYVDCVAWDKGALLIHENFKHGDLIIVHGKVQNDNFVRDDKTISKIKFRVERFEFPTVQIIKVKEEEEMQTDPLETMLVGEET